MNNLGWMERMNFNLLLIRPYSSTGKVFSKISGIMPPLNLAYLASYIEKKISINQHPKLLSAMEKFDQENYEDAINDIKEYLKIEPNHLEGNIILGQIYQKQDKKDVAVRGEKTQMSLKERQQFIIEGLPNVSAVIAKRLLSHFGSVKDIANATEEELLEVKGVGKNIAADIIKLLNANYLQD